MKKGIKPIKPEDVVGLKQEIVPDEVFEVFNLLIAQNFKGGSANVLQKDVVELLLEKGLSRSDIYNKGWLDIEPVYRENGWKVEYDKPGYNESYEASFNFSARKGKSA
jgi:hypothetical protein